MRTKIENPLFRRTLESFTWVSANRNDPLPSVCLLMVEQANKVSNVRVNAYKFQQRK